MSSLETALRLVIRLGQHPVSQRVLRYAVRQATVAIVRQVQKRTRGGVSGGMHIH